LVGFDHDLLGPRRDEIGDPRAIAVTCYSLADPSFSPPGTTHLVIMDLQYSEPWTRLSPAEYLDYKFAYGSKLIDFAQRTFPGLREKIVEADVATPITVMRYLRHPGGAIYGFDQTPSESALFRSNDIVVPGLYLAGAWTGTGGFQPTLTAGAAAADAVLLAISRTSHSATGTTR
jgi:phytoene dehydrogenase-like protein